MQPVSARVTKRGAVSHGSWWWVCTVQVGCCANVVVKTGHGLWQFCQVELDDYLPVLLPVCVSALSARQPPAPNTLPPPLPAQLLSSAQQWHRVEKSSAQQYRRVLYGPATPVQQHLQLFFLLSPRFNHKTASTSKLYIL